MAYPVGKRNSIVKLYVIINKNSAGELNKPADKKERNKIVITKHCY